MTFIKRGGIDRKVMREKEVRKSISQAVNQLNGGRAKGAQRGDYKLCRESDKQYADYRKYKNPKDREKISRNLEQIRKEGQNG